MAKPSQYTEFAERVERLCDFLLDQYKEELGRDGSADLKVLEDLKETAANFHCGGVGHASLTLEGLDTFMQGHSSISKKESP